ncbi:MAG: RNA polymerase sigma factor [Sandaracinaceae bacterium]
MLFDDVYSQELRYVFNTLRRLGIPLRDMEDVAHDVFVVVHAKLADFEDGRPVRPWLFGIAFRVASDYRRKHSNLKERLHTPIPEDPRSATDPWPAFRTREAVAAALDEILLEPRAVLVLHDIEGVTAKEISAALDMPVNRVYSRLRIAREAFRKAMQRHTGEGGT